MVILKQLAGTIKCYIKYNLQKIKFKNSKLNATTEINFKNLEGKIFSEPTKYYLTWTGHITYFYSVSGVEMTGFKDKATWYSVEVKWCDFTGSCDIAISTCMNLFICTKWPSLVENNKRNCS